MFAKHLHKNREGAKKRGPKIGPSYGKNYIDGPHFGAQNPAPFLENVAQHRVALLVALGRKSKNLSSPRKGVPIGMAFSPSYLYDSGPVRKAPNLTGTAGHHHLRAQFGVKKRPPFGGGLLLFCYIIQGLLPPATTKSSTSRLVLNWTILFHYHQQPQHN